MESDITLNDDIGYSKTTGAEEPKYATYKWNFGDETPEVTGVAPGAPSLNSPETSPCELPWQTPCAASTFHSYQYGGKYNVTLTVTDTGGNAANRHRAGHGCGSVSSAPSGQRRLRCCWREHPGRPGRVGHVLLLLHLLRAWPYRHGGSRIQLAQAGGKERPRSSATRSTSRSRAASKFCWKPPPPTISGSRARSRPTCRPARPSRW